MTDHPNAAMIRWALDTIRAGDAEAVKAIWADDIEWHQIGLREPIRTKDELFTHLAQEDSAGHEWRTHDVIGNEEHVVALTTDTVTIGGQMHEFRVARVYHVRDGKVVARWELYDDPRLLELMTDGS